MEFLLSFGWMRQSIFCNDERPSRAVRIINRNADPDHVGSAFLLWAIFKRRYVRGEMPYFCLNTFEK